MALNFTTTREAAALHGIKSLVYGPAGAGKTRLCATAPDPIIISAEAGLLSLREHDIPTIVIKTFAELDEAYQFVAYSQHAKQFLTVCLDSITELAEQCLTAEKGKSKDPRKAYGEMQDEVIKRVKWFRDLPGKHVYMSCKMAQNKDEVSGMMLYGPMMPGQKVGPQLPYLFDEVFALRNGQTQEGQIYNYLQTFRDLQYDAKDRSGALDHFETPNLTTVFDKIQKAA